MVGWGGIIRVIGDVVRCGGNLLLVAIWVMFLVLCLCMCGMNCWRVWVDVVV